jgi:uncharacterized repeat protein (TIGR03803 family)
MGHYDVLYGLLLQALLTGIFKEKVMTSIGRFRSLFTPDVARSLAMTLLLALPCGLAIVASPSAHAQSFSVIHTFNDPSGVFPYAGVTVRASVLYGTTLCTRDCTGNGTVYQLAPVGSNWYFTPISLLSAGGETPLARVVFGPDNHLYGTTFGGGPQGYGAVFSLTPRPTICPTANCFWTEKVLHLFTGSPDGDGPEGGDLVWDQAGNIYGTTLYGGTSSLGTVYQMTKSGDNWTEAPIYSFTGPDGEQPGASVILDGNGNVFGTTIEGGLYGAGTVFELTYNISSGWTENVLYNFQNLDDGQQPLAGLAMDSAGNLYGATTDGGSGGGGTVFELSPVGNTWTFTVIYGFSGQPGKNCGPRASLNMDNSGNLYGTTFCDGANNLGSVFKLTSTQDGWEYTSLHDFAGGTDGSYSFSNVTIDAGGTLYGTAEAGGNLTCNPPLGCGTVWMIKP